MVPQKVIKPFEVPQRNAKKKKLIISLGLGSGRKGLRIADAKLICTFECRNNNIQK